MLSRKFIVIANQKAPIKVYGEVSAKTTDEAIINGNRLVNVRGFNLQSDYDGFTLIEDTDNNIIQGES